MGPSALLSEGPGLRAPYGRGVEYMTEERGRRVPPWDLWPGEGAVGPHQGFALAPESSQSQRLCAWLGGAAEK